jgi:hypothetical protein
MKQWQTELVVSYSHGQRDTRKIITARSLPELREQARLWLINTKPQRFETNASFIDGGASYYQNANDGNRWWRMAGMSNVIIANTLEDAARHFVERDLLPQPGADYVDRLRVDGELQIHAIQTVKRIYELETVNSYLRRGWVLIGTEAVPERDITFVIAHSEVDAT